MVIVKTVAERTEKTKRAKVVVNIFDSVKPGSFVFLVTDFFPLSAGSNSFPLHLLVHIFIRQQRNAAEFALHLISLSLSLSLSLSFPSSAWHKGRRLNDAEGGRYWLTQHANVALNCTSHNESCLGEVSACIATRVMTRFTRTWPVKSTERTLPLFGFATVPTFTESWARR